MNLQKHYSRGEKKKTTKNTQNNNIEEKKTRQHYYPTNIEKIERTTLYQ